MKRGVVVLLWLLSVNAVAQQRTAQLLCHRTANKDAPENTMESLEQAALLGCDVVEVDVRRTMDGVLVLNHDGFTERLTDGSGEIETTMFDDLAMRDFGSWMGDRWRDLHIARFEDALVFARLRHLQLFLDIKTKGIGPDVLAALDRESMRDHVRFGGEWDDIRLLLPTANGGAPEAWLQPGATGDEIAELQRQGKRVIVNFSANSHEMDLAAMRKAVVNGADGINVDYPRLGADAVGRPVEATLEKLTLAASHGESGERVKAIALLARYRVTPLEDRFVTWLGDPDPHVSRAAAVALVTMRPLPSHDAFLPALNSNNTATQANAAWALGVLKAPAIMVLPLLHSEDTAVLEEALMALSNMPGRVSAAALIPLLNHPDIAVCGAAALALAAHAPLTAQALLPGRIRAELTETLHRYDAWVAQGQPKLTAVEIKVITDHYRAEMKLFQAVSMLDGAPSLSVFEQQAFHPGQDFTQVLSDVAAFRLWDRIGEDPGAAVVQLGSADTGVADRAEWMLTMAGSGVDGAVRSALHSPNAQIRQRAVRIAGFRGDTKALPELHTLSDPTAAWAIEKIRQLHSGYETVTK